MTNRYISFIAQKTAEIREEELDPSVFTPQSVAGKTVCSMISAGTEINGIYLDVFNNGYPRKAGYTVVFRVERIGEEVEGISIGDLVFCMAPHQTYQVKSYKEVIKVTNGLPAEHALFARLAGVSMATLSRTEVKAGEKAVVTGLGTVGYMAMLIYSSLGYEMIGVDPDENRRKTAREAGFTEIYDKMPFDKHGKTIGLALECSGNESAVLDCCKAVRPHGEVSVVGVPWKACTDIKAHELLRSVFYDYVKIYSGWEMDLPFDTSKFVHESMKKNYDLAMRLMREGKVRVDGLYSVRPFDSAQSAYDDIYEKREKKIAVIFKYE